MKKKQGFYKKSLKNRKNILHYINFSHNFHKTVIFRKCIYDIVKKIKIIIEEKRKMIAIGSDHGGYALKEELKKYLEEKGIEYKDFGTYSEERTDYPIYGRQVVEAVQSKDFEKGILICGTGFGMTMVANKYKGIRCASCWNEEVAKLLKEHNNANIIALPGRFINISQAVSIVRAWLGAEFLTGRHTERLQMIEEIEKENMK